MRATEAAVVRRATVRAQRDQLKVLCGRWRADRSRAVAVHSSTELNRFYLARTEGGRIVYECPGSQHGRICKHAAAIRLVLIAEREA
jgi:hypothetical protein